MKESAAHKPSNLNIANVLTVIRIAGVPLFGWVLLHDGGDSSTWRVWAWVIFAVLMATDKVDGDLARKHNLVTDFGKLADPIADKALTGMAFVGLAIIYANEPWAWLLMVAVTLILLREWGLTGYRGLLARRGLVQPANKGGKLKTVVQALAIGGYVLPLEMWDGVVPEALRWITHLLMAVAFVLTIVTGFLYVRDARRDNVGS
jgi:CDP-diacylglycerol--glycerol-3-phosphate 3-phosphatidyltransferase